MEKTRKYIGKGRGSKDRAYKTIETVRFEITKIIRLDDEIKRKKSQVYSKEGRGKVPAKRINLSKKTRLRISHSHLVEDRIGNFS